MLNNTYHTIITLLNEEIRRIKVSSGMSQGRKKSLEGWLRDVEEAKQDFIDSANKKSGMTIAAAYSIRGKDDEE